MFQQRTTISNVQLLAFPTVLFVVKTPDSVSWRAALHSQPKLIRDAIFSKSAALRCTIIPQTPSTVISCFSWEIKRNVFRWGGGGLFWKCCLILETQGCREKQFHFCFLWLSAIRYREVFSWPLTGASRVKVRSVGEEWGEQHAVIGKGLGKAKC